MESSMKPVASFKSSLIVGWALVLFGLSVAAHAEDEDGFSGNMRLGYLATSGNTDSESGNVRARLDYRTGPWTHTFTGGAIGSREDDETNAESYELGARTNFDFNEYDFAFGRLAWRKDKFGGIDEQFSQTAGYGRRLLNTERHRWNVELGAGARQATRRDGVSENEAILRFGSDYRLRFNERATLTADLGVESGADNTITEFEVGLRSQLLSRFAFVASYTIRYNTDVPPGSTSTDRYTSLSLEYSF